MSVSITFSVYRGEELVHSETMSRQIVKVGRLQSSHLCLDDEAVSRMHAVIETTPQGDVHIIDLGSSSGTVVNGERIDKAKLEDGDTIGLGPFRVVVHVDQPTAVGAKEATGAAAAAEASATPERGDETKPGEGGAKRKPSFNPFQVGAKQAPNPFAAPAAATKPHPAVAEGASSVAVESGEYYNMVAAGPPVPAHEVETSERAIEVAVLWGDRHVLNVDHLTPPRDYYVGEPNGAGEVDFIIGSHGLGASRMPVCVTRGAGVAAVVPEGAIGTLTVGNEMQSFDQLRHNGQLQRSSEMNGAEECLVPEGGTARVQHKDFTFLVKDVKAGKQVAGPYRIDFRPLIYVAGAWLVASLVLVMFYFAPPRPRGLSSDLFDTDSRLVQFLMEADELIPEEPEFMKGEGPQGGGTGEKHEGDEGQLGDEQSEKNNKRFGIKGPEDNQDLQMAREQAKEEAKTAGILGTIAGMQGSFNAPTSPYGADVALGNDPMSALGAMTGADIGNNFGFGGLGLRGTGRGGGGTGQGTIGMGRFGTIGHGAGRGDGQGGYGSGAGGLRGRSGGVPRVGGNVSNVYGALSKEVIRRVVRRHLNEIKFCYEQQLGARPDLAGTVNTKFVISPTGSVQSAIVTSSKLKNAVVEACMTSSIRRWTFPKPDGGGIVVVNYPFTLNTAGQ